jgi:hypothetical protein
MDLATVSDIYSPSIDNEGNYIDKIPSYMPNGIKCGCGKNEKKNKIYMTTLLFSNHTKTKTHQQWLTSINTNKINYYKENQELNQTIHNQKRIIAKFEKDIRELTNTIHLLTEMKKSSVSTIDLLDFP